MHYFPPTPQNLRGTITLIPSSADENSGPGSQGNCSVSPHPPTSHSSKDSVEIQESWLQTAPPQPLSLSWSLSTGCMSSGSVDSWASLSTASDSHFAHKEPSGGLSKSPLVLEAPASPDGLEPYSDTIHCSALNFIFWRQISNGSLWLGKALWRLIWHAENPALILALKDQARKIFAFKFRS